MYKINRKLNVTIRRYVLFLAKGYALHFFDRNKPRSYVYPVLMSFTMGCTMHHGFQRVSLSKSNRN